MANKDYDYVSIRIKNDTFIALNDIKDSYSEFCDKKVTMDEFQQILVDALAKTEPEFWEVFTMKKEMQRQLMEKMNAARLKKQMSEDNNS